MDKMMIESAAWIALAIAYVGLFSLWVYAWFRKPTKPISYRIGEKK